MSRGINLRYSCGIPCEVRSFFTLRKFTFKDSASLLSPRTTSQGLCQVSLALHKLEAHHARSSSACVIRNNCRSVNTPREENILFSVKYGRGFSGHREPSLITHVSELVTQLVATGWSKPSLTLEKHIGTRKRLE